MKLFIFQLTFLIVPTLAIASPAADLKARLQRFQSQPKLYMNETPIKKNSQGQVAQPKNIFENEQLTLRQFVTSKDLLRKKICSSVSGIRKCIGDIYPGRAAIEGNDNPQELVDNGDRLIKSIFEMEKQKLTFAELKTTPWSDSYWPVYQGVLGARYAHKEYPSSKSWKTYYNFSSKKTAREIIAGGNPQEINSLSPSEKYDLLIGDSDGQLTSYMWRQGQEYYDEYKKVETWMGVCHGWAPAAYMLPRPEKSVEISVPITTERSTEIVKIKFYPSDLKALGSYLWAQVNVESRFIGGRCSDKSPTEDDNGRVQSQDCFDTNPGTWHMAIVNQIGVSKRSFVFDATYDYEVWNQPVYSYSYSYFNPQTLDASDDLKSAMVAIKDYSNDKFKKYRSAKTKYVVGVAMEVYYVVETNPNHSPTDSADRDALNNVTYEYDLELDATGNIIGGEWYHNKHPDFLWTPAPGTKAMDIGSRYARGSWSGEEALSDSWKQAAAIAAAEGQPLAKIVEVLFNKANARP